MRKRCPTCGTFESLFRAAHARNIPYVMINTNGKRIAHNDRFLAEPHDSALSEMVRQIRTRLLAFEITRGLGKVSVPGFDLTAAKQMALAAQDAIGQGRLGYVIMTATISDSPQATH